MNEGESNEEEGRIKLALLLEPIQLDVANNASHLMCVQCHSALSSLPLAVHQPGV